MGSNVNVGHRQPWNKAKIVGQKAPFKLKEIWALRVRLQMESRVRELALAETGARRCRQQGREDRRWRRHGPTVFAGWAN